METSGIPVPVLGIIKYYSIQTNKMTIIINIIANKHKNEIISNNSNFPTTKNCFLLLTQFVFHWILMKQKNDSIKGKFFQIFLSMEIHNTIFYLV